MNKIYRFRLLFAFFLVCSLSGCGDVRLIGAYDDKIDDGIETVSKDLATIFVKIDKDIDKGSDWSYSVFEPDYIAVESELSVVTIRATALPKYKIILNQLTLLTSSVKTLEADHKSGFVRTGASTADLKKAIAVDQSAINTSIGAMLALQQGLKRDNIDKSK